ncbi:DNA-binding transcriptional LysR family regulator [Amycolatopsis bartoniae]|uniref:LysR family transcriptional regulator n=1 Tax=Amycolatopsis bartoniae TaxID=941986 RepID=A0A8H9INT2_9PSEU|nr:LysR family transcriptional regulator [Amycolatopsis bartoniae]MBB2937724.1 DNA-binding transcriptional LysR family regulator [Amycolatopsis bartoniae]TVT08192.1 LysR family transcriptional regulator [Amycolatopsis bartoniae]GHF40215.1 LysR family transcriptional regulator [Amycolatopsis bartoniae]
MDLVGACRAFASVSERGSFTLGAAAAGIPQSVASRRIAALEQHLGDRLFDRATRRAVLTPFGRDVLPAAQRLVRLADALEHDARQARRRPLRLAVPDWCPPRELAHLDAEARDHDVVLDFRPAPPAVRADLLRTREVRAALAAVPADEAHWTVPLGVAAALPPAAPTVYLETLRPGRGAAGTRAPRVWLQPEDDVPHVRDRLVHLRDQLGLRPSQVAVADSLVSATADVLGSADLLLCSAAQAVELDLHWRPVGEVGLVRGFALATTYSDDADRLRPLARAIARCLGAPGEGEA